MTQDELEQLDRALELAREARRLAAEIRFELALARLRRERPPQPGS